VVIFSTAAAERVASYYCAVVAYYLCTVLATTLPTAGKHGDYSIRKK